MKKIILFLLVALSGVCLSACSGNKETDEGQKDFETSHEKTANGGILISDEEFSGYITKIDLTTENWKEYFDVVEDKNGIYGLHAKNHKNAVSQFAGRTATIEIKDLKTGAINFFHVSESLVMQTDESYTLSDFECVSIDGSILIATVPEELWQNANPEQLWELSEKGVPTVYVGNAETYTWYSQEFGIGNDLQVYF